MGYSVIDQDDEVLVVSTPSDLSTQTTAGQYKIHLDLNAMVNGDEMVLKVYTKARSAATERLEYPPYVFADAQAAPNAQSIWYAIGYSVRFELEQTAGTARTVPWAVHQIT